jgi:protein-tyrosine phosphatase
MSQDASAHAVRVFVAVSRKSGKETRVVYFSRATAKDKSTRLSVDEKGDTELMDPSSLSASLDARIARHAARVERNLEDGRYDSTGCFYCQNQQQSQAKLQSPAGNSSCGFGATLVELPRRVPGSLFLGSLFDAADVAQLRGHSIALVASLCFSDAFYGSEYATKETDDKGGNGDLSSVQGDGRGVPVSREQTSRWYRDAGVREFVGFDLKDRAEADIEPVFAELLPRVLKALSAGENCLVHCQAGQSRSAACVLAIQMKLGVALDEAFTQTAARRFIMPNRTFFSALARLEMDAADPDGSANLGPSRTGSKAFSELPSHEERRRQAVHEMLAGEYPELHSMAPGGTDDVFFLGTQTVAGIGAPDVPPEQIREQLQTLRITHIVSCCGDETPFRDAGIQYWTASLPHKPERDGVDGWARLDRALPEAAQFINSALDRGQGVFVHCNNGQNRSAAVAIAALMARHRWGADRAFDFVRTRRAVVDTKLEPALRAFEAELQKSGEPLKFLDDGK